MKPIYRILTYLMCALPGVAGAAPVATTAGDNLTAYNPSSMGSISNNQWNSMLNGRGGSGTAPTADFGNCNAVIMRCASPKCSGCTTLDIARPIVTGCVNTNLACKQYGTDLIEYISAQIVSSANAKVQQATINANAAAAQNAATQNNAQIQQLQEQMADMQASMQAQNAETIRQLENALAEQKEMTAAAQQQVTDAQIAQNATNESGLTAAQQVAIDRGIDTDLVVRADITGQITSKIENAETNLKNLYNTMQTAFKYAECDTRGDNCKSPKRVKTFKDKAIQFIQPYDDVIDDMYEALEMSLAVGVDISDVIMTLNGSCNQWGKYVCYGTQKVANCTAVGEACYVHNYEYYNTITDPDNNTKKLQTCVNGKSKAVNGSYVKGGQDCTPGAAVPPQDDIRCTLIELLDAGGNPVERIWMEEHADGGDKLIRVGCATSALDSISILNRRNNRRGASIDLDILERIILQEPSDSLTDTAIDYCCCKHDTQTTKCANDCDSQELESLVALKKLPESSKICAEKTNEAFSLTSCTDEDAYYINPMLALCSVHPYNIGETTVPKDTNKSKMRDVIALKTTIITQQMYKQYQQMESLLNRLKTQLQKAVLANRLQVAGGKSSSNDDESSYGGKSSWEDEIKDCQNLYSSDTEKLNCYSENLAAFRRIYNSEGSSNKLRKKITADYNSLYDMHTGGDGDKCDITTSTTDANNQSTKPADCDFGKTNKDAHNACFTQINRCIGIKRKGVQKFEASLGRTNNNRY